MVLKVCRICLATDCRMYSMRDYQLIEAYRLLTGLRIIGNDKLPKMLCVECAHRLNNFNKFRDKCLRANELMLDLLNDDDLTLETFRSIDRRSHRLTSDLTSQVNVSNDRNDVVEVKIEKVTLPLDDDDVLVIDEKVKKEDQHYNDINPEFLIEVDVLNRNDDSDKKNDSFETGFNLSDYSPMTFEIVNTDTETSKKSLKKKDKKKVQKSKTKKVPDADEKGVKKKKSSRKKGSNVKGDKSYKSRTDATFGGTFDAKLLTPEEQRAEILKRQETDNYRHSKYKCEKCFRGFVVKDVYDKHMIKHTDADGPLECKTCLTRFKTKLALQKHFYRHIYLFNCALCDGFSTTDRVLASHHAKQHKGIKYTCQHCGEVFLFSTTYFNHLRIKHPSDFICQLCGYSFVSQKGVLAHQKLSHDLDGTKPEIPLDGPSCDTCNIRFASTDAYETHLKISEKHVQNDSNLPRREYNQGGISRMNRLKSVNRPVTCEQCGEVLPTSRSYYYHFRVNHPGKNRTRFAGEPNMCEVCGRVFPCAYHLRAHKLVHEGQSLQLACDICGKVLTSKGGLRTHKKSHLPSTRTQCNVCLKYFSSIPNMKRHKLIHTGIKPFKCVMCPKEFLTKEEKVQHEDHIHLKKPWPKRQRGQKTGSRRRTRQDDDDEENKES